LGGSPEGKGFLEGWIFFQKELLKVQEQAVLMCQKVSRQGKETSLAEQRALAGTQEKKREFVMFGRRVR